MECINYEFFKIPKYQDKIEKFKDN